MFVFTRVLIYAYLILVGYVVQGSEIEVYYFTASDVKSSTQSDIDSVLSLMDQAQSFFGYEMNRHGFGYKTFQFKKFVVEVVGDANLKHYANHWNIINEIPSIKRGDEGQIYVIFLAGTNKISRGNANSQFICDSALEDISGCNNVVIVPMEQEEVLLPLLAHELGHAFGLLHHAKEKKTLGLIDIMYYPLTIEPGVIKYLDLFGFTYENAAVIVDRLTLIHAPLSSSVRLSFNHKSKGSITPINPPNEWDGWVVGHWYKNFGQSPPIMNPNYQYITEMDELTHWLYSHAPSRIVYDISGSNYTALSFSLFTTNFNTRGMNVKIQIDNNEIYSKRITVSDNGISVDAKIPDGHHRFLTISVEDDGDMFGDHFLLGEPTLHRNTQNRESKNQYRIKADVNNDGQVDLDDVRLVRKATKENMSFDTDLNEDGVTDEIDVIIAKTIAFEEIAAVSPSKTRLNITNWATIKQ